MFASFSDFISNHLLLFGPLICGICGVLLRKPVAKILSSKKVGENGALAVIGAIRNEGLQSTGGISVEVTFYGKTNELVDTSMTYLSGNFSHGEARAFKVSFGCEGHPVHGDYDHYVATVR